MLYNANGSPAGSSNASAVIYVPSVPANWNPSPANVQAALDQLATNNLTKTGNVAALGPLATLALSTPAITPIMSQKYLVLANVSVVASTSSNITATLTQGGTTLDVATSGTGAAGPLNLSCIGVFQGTAAAQAFTITVTTASGTITAVINGLSITVLEDT
jgi:hypothetical protein